MLLFCQGPRFEPTCLFFRRQQDVEKVLLLEEGEPVERREEDDDEEDVRQVAADVQQKLGQGQRVDGQLARPPGPGPGLHC